MSLPHGKADIIENSVKTMSSRGNDVVKMLIDMQWISTLRNTRHSVRIGEREQNKT